MLTIVEHPLLKRDLSILRNEKTPHGVFRKVLSDASTILAYEAMRQLSLESIEIQTPIEATRGFLIKDAIVVVPILRAGLGMVDGFIKFVPEASVGHLGMYRNEETHEPVDYYANMPKGLATSYVFLVDPMLATGGSALAAIKFLKNRGVRSLHFVCLVASPEGIKLLQSHYPEVQITTASVDRELNANAYICPGLGDAGDRIFGT